MYYFATVLLILLSGNATFLPFYNINWFIVEFIFIWIGIENSRFTKEDLKLFANFALMYLGYCTVRSALFNNLPLSYYISDVIYLFKYILPSFLFCALVKDKAIYYLSRVIIDGAVVSIFFFIVQMLAGNVLYSIGKAINIPPISSQGFDYTNFIVFNYVLTHLYQNSGFAWEPGAYGFFLNLGLMFHFLSNGFTIDKKAKWLIVGILTTVSTTSFIALSIIFLLYFRSRGVKYSWIILLATPVLCVALFQLPFLADKIIYTYKADLLSLKNISFLTKYYAQTNETFALNRFASIIIIYDTFGAKIILGISNIWNESVPILKNINISNGIFEFFAKFGIVGLGFLLYRAYLFFKTYTNNIEHALYCVIIILIMGFGEAIFVLPLTTAFIFMYYYAQGIDEENDDDENMDEIRLNGVV